MTFVSIRNSRGVVVLHGEMSVWVWTYERAVREESQVLQRIFLVKRGQRSACDLIIASRRCQAQALRADKTAIGALPTASCR